MSVVPENGEYPRPTATEVVNFGHITGENAERLGDFGLYRKIGLSRISNFTVPPGTKFCTPEGLHAEDEPCRVAFDSQGGVYPIRESVFAETYELVLDDEKKRPAAEREDLPGG